MPSNPKDRPVKWLYDILRKDFIPRAEPLPVPDTSIFDEPRYCMQFNIHWMPHILGALELLLQVDSWSGGDSEVFRAQQAIYGMLANVVICGEPMRTVELQSILIGDCNQLQWKYTDEPLEAWRNLGSPVCSGVDGVDGVNGLDGAPGPAGPAGECPDCPPVSSVPAETTTPPTTGRSCGGAYGTVSELLEILNYNLDTLESSGEITSSVLTLVSLNLKNTLEAVPLVGLVITGLESILNIGVNITRIAINDPDFDDSMACLLYCAIEDNGGTFNQTAFNAWIADMKSTYTFPAAEYAFIDLVEKFVGYESISRLFAIESLNTDNRCAAGCGCEWCYTFNFQASNGGFTAISNNGQWVSGQGWKQSTVVGQIAIQRTYTLAVGSKITSLKTTITGATAINGGTGLRTPMPTLNSPTNSVTHTFNLDYTGNTIVIVFDSHFTSPSNPSWAGALATVEIRGRGVNPFGSDNC